MFLKSMKIFIHDFDYDSLRWRNLDKTKIVYLFRILNHPLETLSDIKYEGKGSLALSNIIMLLLFIESIFSYSATGFIFNLNQPENFNIMLEFTKSDLLVILWCIANWMVCSITDGEGKFSHIWITSWYAMLPKVLLDIPALILSNLLIKNEAAFISVILTFSTVWSLLLIFFATMTVQQFTVKKTIASILLTLFSMCIIIFISVLFFSFFQQLISFIATISSELIHRL